jgi:twinkle protein
MQMSKVSMVEQRARQLDGERKVRLLKSEEIDTEKYLKAHDVSHKVHEAEVWLQELHEELIRPPEQIPIITLPWAKTHAGFQFRSGEVTLYAGSNGGGKSLITGQVCLSLIKQNQRVCVASFEMKPKRTLYRMLRQFSGDNIDFPRYVDKKVFMAKLLDRFTNFSRNHMWLYDQQGTTSSQQVIAMARYCAIELGVQHVFIDSLMKCVAGEDDYNSQKYFVDELTAVARDHNIHIHLIHHIRKLQNEEMQPNKNDIKGTGAIADQVDNVLLMWRNKKKEHEIQNGAIPDPNKPDAMLMCEKQRNGEAEDWYSLWYQKDSQQFIESSTAVPMSFDDGGIF